MTCAIARTVVKNPRMTRITRPIFRVDERYSRIGSAYVISALEHLLRVRRKRASASSALCWKGVRAGNYSRAHIAAYPRPCACCRASASVYSYPSKYKCRFVWKRMIDWEERNAMEAMPQAVRTNFEEKVAYVAHVLPTMRVTQDKSFLAVDCGLPSDTYNVIVVRDLALPHQLLQAGIRPFLEQRFPAAIWYWDAGSFADVQALTALGLVHTETAVAMAADLSAAGF